MKLPDSLKAKGRHRQQQLKLARKAQQEQQQGEGSALTTSSPTTAATSTTLSKSDLDRMQILFSDESWITNQNPTGRWLHHKSSDHSSEGGSKISPSWEEHPKPGPRIEFPPPKQCRRSQDNNHQQRRSN